MNSFTPGSAWRQVGPDEGLDGSENISHFRDGITTYWVRADRPSAPTYVCWTVVTVHNTYTANEAPKTVVNVYSEPDERTARRVARRLLRDYYGDGTTDGDLKVKVRRAWLIPE